MPDAPVSHPEPLASIDAYQTLPKVDLHRHLEGSLRWETVQEIAVDESLAIPIEQVQIQPGQPRTPQNLLDKFTVLRCLYRSEATIRRVVRESIEDAAHDNVTHLELRFTPAALSQAGSFTLVEVMDWVVQEVQVTSRTVSISARLIASINRHEEIKIAWRVAELALERMQNGIAALDLAGDETRYPAAPFLPIFQFARQGGLKICLHAGEWANGKNLMEAIQTFAADRIGHGIRILRSPAAVSVALNKGIFFEVCPSSNVFSGAAQDYNSHPLKDMLVAGLGVTINTDNPGITGVPLSREYLLAAQEIGLSQEQLKICALNAAQAAFLSPPERQQLVTKLAGSFD